MSALRRAVHRIPSTLSAYTRPVSGLTEAIGRRGLDPTGLPYPVDHELPHRHS